MIKTEKKYSQIVLLKIFLFIDNFIMYILSDIEYYYCFDPGPGSASEDLSSSL